MVMSLVACDRCGREFPAQGFDRHAERCDPDRDARIEDLRRAGKTLEEIAAAVGLKKAMVGRILQRRGVTKPTKLKPASDQTVGKLRTPADGALPDWKLYGISPSGSVARGICVQRGCTFRAPTAGQLLRHLRLVHRVPSMRPDDEDEMLRRRVRARTGDQSSRVFVVNVRAAS